MKRHFFAFLLLLLMPPVLVLERPCRAEGGALNGTSSVPRTYFQQLVDALIKLAVTSRIPNNPVAVVAGVKGFVKKPSLESAAFRYGRSLAVLRYAEGTGDHELILDASRKAAQELEVLLDHRRPPDNIESMCNADVLPDGLRSHYELGLWLEALRMPLMKAVSQEEPSLPPELTPFLTINNMAPQFHENLEKNNPPPGVLSALLRLSVYMHNKSFSTFDMRKILKDLDFIVAAYS